jgi:hypothetical protein
MNETLFLVGIIMAWLIVILIYYLWFKLGEEFVEITKHLTLLGKLLVTVVIVFLRDIGKIIIACIVIVGLYIAILYYACRLARTINAICAFCSGFTPASRFVGYHLGNGGVFIPKSRVLIDNTLLEEIE